MLTYADVCWRMLADGRPGGANIRALIEEFSLTNIDIQETGTSGTHFTCCPSTKVRILTPEELRCRQDVSADIKAMVGFTEVMRDDTPSAAGSAAYTSILLYVDVASTR